MNRSEEKLSFSPLSLPMELENWTGSRGFHMPRKQVSLSANLFCPESRQNLLQRIDYLYPKSRRHWGTMSLPQMLAHCSLQIEIALGHYAADPAGEFPYRLKICRFLHFYLLPFQGGKKTIPIMDMDLHPAISPDFATQKMRLLSSISRFLDREELAPHPLFGRISSLQWGRLIWIHLNHHLIQFGQ